MKSLKSQKGFTHIILVGLMVLVIAGLGLYVYKHNSDVKKANSSANLPGVSKTVKRPGVIKAVQFSTSVDSQGKATAPSSVFAPTDSKIQTVLTLQNATKGTRTEFVRYLNNKFVNNGGLTIAKDGAQYVGFDFSLKSGKTHPKGVYKVKVYTNGIYETAASYTVR